MSTSASASSPAVPTSATAPRRAIGAATWVTAQHDAARTGADPAEPAVGSVRRLWSSAGLDGSVYAQPLVVGDEVVVATDHDTVYALDAGRGSIRWRNHFGEPVPGDALPCGDVDPVGVTGTPVIDPVARRVYVVGMVRPARHLLVTLSLDTGAVVAQQAIDAPGADPLTHNQRGALTFANGRVYVPFGGRFGDCGDYRGVVVSVRSGGGALVVYRVPTRRQGGVWAPSGVAVDAGGDLFIATGNSDSTGSYDDGNSVLRVSPDLTRVVGSFAPDNWAALNSTDSDLGSVTPALLSGRRVFQIGKAGVGYLLDADHLGGIGGQLASASVCSGGAYGGTAQGSGLLFVPCRSGVVALAVSGSSFRTVWRGPGFPAGAPIVAGNAVWVLDVGAGVLHALDVGTGAPYFAEEVGSVTRFAAPAAGDGAVFVAAGGKVIAFGGV